MVSAVDRYNKIYTYLTPADMVQFVDKMTTCLENLKMSGI